MKTFFLAVVAIAIGLIPVFGWLPWEMRGKADEGPVRFTFLLVLGVVLVVGCVLFLRLMKLSEDC